ncbi:MAG: hypothetical protein H7Y10_01070 [Flavobacterium sp.]|nr:hypothetical protein [Flavobacterium sp.]
MRKILFLVVVLFSVVFLQNCKSSKSNYVAPKTISYKKDITPILQTSCTPCHFPPEGKKEALDSYATVSSHITEIIARVKLPKEDRKFMPYKSKKPALNDSLVNVLVTWQKQDMPQ